MDDAPVECSIKHGMCYHQKSKSHFSKEVLIALVAILNVVPEGFMELTGVIISLSFPGADDFDLSDALDDDPNVPTGADDFDLSDAFDDDPNAPIDDNDGFDLNDALQDDTTQPRDDNDGFDLNDALQDDTTQPRDDNVGFDLNDALQDDTTQPRDPDGFDLNDALNGHSVKKTGRNFDDSDLLGVVNGDYKPEKTGSKGQDPPAATDLISDFLMTLIGDTSENFKKICFSIMEMLNDLYNTPQEQ
ncbi:uncharacterized protein LOC144595421 [Rhinoraja longicauda]